MQLCVFSGLNKLEGLSLGLIELEGNMYSCIHLLYIGPDCLCELMNTINYLCAQTILQFGSKESSDDPEWASLPVSAPSGRTALTGGSIFTTWGQPFGW